MTTEAQQARDEAIDRVERHAPAEWLGHARACVAALACIQRTFTTDDVWQIIGQPPEPRAMGAVMRWATAAGIATATPDYTPSVRPACHARPIRVWRRGPKVDPDGPATPHATLAALREKYAA